MVTNWLIGIGSILAGLAAVWTVVQQHQLNKHSQRIRELEKRYEDS